MFRRRRPLKDEAIHFSFDSFLDLVTNVVGIIIRLILVTWVGARSYHTAMTWLEVESIAPITAPKAADDPLHARIEQANRDLDDAKTRLLDQMKKAGELDNTAQLSETQLASLIRRREELEAERKRLQDNSILRDGKIVQVSLSVEDVRKRSRKLLEEIQRLETGPSNKKELKYHAPVSRAVRSEELFFECKAGRVTYIDLPSFLQEYRTSQDEIANELKSKWRVERTTSPVGPYRLRYVVERERSALDAGATPGQGSFRYGLSAWEVEPIATQRGESVEQALREKSEFRQLVDPLDPSLTVATFWVYPDSFELFRTLRDHLYERGHDVAGRPLPLGTPIAASKHGSASRGQ
ncbi:MAG: hypothetical protein HYR84_16490 [Planctomycetes bacterium]|nr:hypothetical protein [Planctomycetota bacterium]